MIVFGFFHNACTFESAAALMSLHTTKAGAWQALRRYTWDTAVKSREFHLEVGGCPDMYHMPDWQVNFVEALKVFP